MRAHYLRAFGKTAIVALVFCGAFFVASSADAATFSVSPASGGYSVGETFTVSVLVASSQSLNAVSGTLHFPPDALQVTSLSKNGSVISLWVQEPFYSNSSGTVQFEGVIPNPGYTGSGGRVIAVTFRVRSTGSALVEIRDGQILANDGEGTNILTSSGDGSYTFSEAAEAPPPPPSSKKEVTPLVENPELEAPIITNVSRTVEVDGMAEVSGTSIYPGATARLELRGRGGVFTSEASVGRNGVFTIVRQNTVDPGRYEGSVTIERGGERSAASDPFAIVFEGKAFLTRLVEFLMEPFVAICLAFLIAFILGLLAARFLWRVHPHSKPVHEALHEVDSEVHKAFLAMREGINQALEELESESEKRELTHAERRFVNSMTSTIKESEKAIAKDIRDAER